MEIETDIELERPVTLADVLDADSLQRICMVYTRTYNTGVAVFDAKGEVLVDIPADHAMCRRITGHPRGRNVCSGIEFFASSGYASGPGEDLVTKQCLCGLRYAVIGIRHEKDELGRLVFGPYRESGQDQVLDGLSEHLTDDKGNLDVDIVTAANRDLQKIMPLKREDVTHIVRSIGDILAVIVHSGFARHLTSQIHITAIQDAYNELAEKNRRLADSVEKLKELDKLKSTFLARVSHELRTPLTSILGYSEMLLEGIAGDINDTQKEYIQIITEKSDQLLQIINEILDISKIESGSIQLSREAVNVGELFHQVKDSLMPQARRKKLELSVDAPGDLPLVDADLGKTRQVLLNLLSNAVKFTPQGGTVSAKARVITLEGGISGNVSSWVEISVADNGIGIPAHSKDRIFETFYQVDSSSTRVYGGTGLGLSIVKHFVEAHGGRVWVDSEEGKGSTFFVHLPCYRKQGSDGDGFLTDSDEVSFLEEPSAS